VPDPSSRRPVDARDVNQRLDELFDPQNPHRYQRARGTLREIFRNGLDFSKGHPVPLVCQHLAGRFDGWIKQVHQAHPEIQTEGKAFTQTIYRAGLRVGAALRRHW
jgi:hypothetical protein